MIIDTSIKVANYKCFGEEPQGFEKIYPINIIIGKNNVGKSSLIDLIEFSIVNNEKIFQLGLNAKPPTIKVSKQLEAFDLSNKKVVRYISSTHSDTSRDDVLKLMSNYVNKRVVYEINSTSSKNVIDLQDGYLNDTNNHQKIALKTGIGLPFRNKIFIRINADRDIISESMHQYEEINSNGNGATSNIWRCLSLNNQDLIKKNVLNNLNLIVKPDIEFRDIIIKESIEGNNGHALKKDISGEIFFEDKYGSWVSLSNMGSGIKTILLVLVNIYITTDKYYIEIDNFENPINKKREINDFFFCFEELENNLHPSLQRRLFNFIAKFSQQNKVYFFITTHSHIIIDMFSNNPNAQILHVRREGEYSVVDTVVSSNDSRKVLKDLDFRASDLLLSNGIIWVEGPSDVIYLELFLDLYKQSLPESASTERLSYSIQALATAVWKYAGFESLDWDAITNESDLQGKIIALEKLNHNHLLVIDNDGNYDDLKPSEYEHFSNGTGKNKAILINNSMQFAKNKETDLANNYGDTKNDELFFWVNEGTMETYLQDFIDNKGKAEFAKYFDRNAKTGLLEKKRNGEDSSKSKVVLASEIAGFCIKGELKLQDITPSDSALYNKIKRLYNTIKSWN